MTLSYQSGRIAGHFLIAQRLAANEAEQRPISVRGGRGFGVGCQPRIDLLWLYAVGLAFIKVDAELHKPILDSSRVTVVCCAINENGVCQVLELHASIAHVAWQLGAGTDGGLAQLVERYRIAALPDLLSLELSVDPIPNPPHAASSDLFPNTGHSRQFFSGTFFSRNHPVQSIPISITRIKMHLGDVRYYFLSY